MEKHGERVFTRTPSPKPEKRDYFKEQSERMRQSAIPKTFESFAAGDRVKHNIFGEGTVTEVLPMGNDQMLTINFDKRGVKKLMRNNAKIGKL